MKDSKTELLRDLCARLLDHIIVNYRGSKVDLTEYARSVKLECCKPYLRPMSSMTREEKFQYSFYLTRIENAYDASLLIDWLNKNMFDYRGLIEKGLALEALEYMYNIKKK